MKGSTKHFDKQLVGLIACLIVIGFIMLASASVALSEKERGYAYYYLYRQALLGLGLGSIFMATALRLPMTFWKKWAPLLFAGGLMLLVLVLIPPFGHKVNGARRWIYLGSASFQPSEFAKIFFVLYLASWMSGHKKDLHHITRGFVPFLGITGAMCGLILLQPNMSTMGITALTGLGMYFLGGGRLRHIMLAGLIGILAFGILVASGYRRDRVMTFLNPHTDQTNSGYQIKQSLIAIGSGGFFGRGLGLSRQKFQYLPEPAGDAIFAILAEELGLLGAASVLGIFFWLIIRGMMVAAHAKDMFSQLVASGIVLLVAIQVVVNVGALSGIMPLTGIPLPFISYGGTALAVLLFEMGLLLQISRKG